MKCTTDVRSDTHGTRAQSVADLSAAENHGFLGAEPSSDTADPQWVAMDGAGDDDPEPIPTASVCGLGVMMMLLLTAGTLVCRRVSTA